MPNISCVLPYEGITRNDEKGKRPKTYLKNKSRQLVKANAGFRTQRKIKREVKKEEDNKRERKVKEGIKTVVGRGLVTAQNFVHIPEKRRKKQEECGGKRRKRLFYPFIFNRFWVWSNIRMPDCDELFHAVVKEWRKQVQQGRKVHAVSVKECRERDRETS